MKIIAHAGHWFKKEAKNSIEAFENALKKGFSIEADFRDKNEEIVISHDPATVNSIDARLFFQLCNQYPEIGPHAINIKSCGLQNQIARYISEWNPDRYFVFDTSIPDSIGYIKKNINIFTRVSEYEAYQDFNNKASGVWLDSFNSDWYGKEEIIKYLKLGKYVSIVSPELHGRDHLSLWREIKSISYLNNKISICTDFPSEAREYFDEKN